MNYLKFYLFVISTIVISCKLFDNTPPSITITSHESGQTVGELVLIQIDADDKYGIDKIKLFINDSLVTTLKKKPFEYLWNTLNFANGEYIIKAKSSDESGNSKETDPIILIVDNNIFKPSKVGITSIEYEKGGFTITWNKSPDSDFNSYQLEESLDSTMSDYSILHSTQDKNDITYFDSDINPLIFQYYRITVYDTLGLESIGQIYPSSLDPKPKAIDIKTISYTYDEMTVSWDKSTDSDFKKYTLFYSESNNGNKQKLEEYTDINVTSYITEDFDPTIENWYWIEVEDTLSQKSIGQGLSNETDSFPVNVNIITISYNFDEMTVSWDKSTDSDFKKYTLFYSESNNGNKQKLEEYTDINVTSYITEDFDPTIENWYWIEVEDYWKQKSMGNGKSNAVDSPPSYISNFSSQYDNGNYNISWQKNTDHDFKSYTLYGSNSSNMSNKWQVFHSDNQNETSTVLNNQPNNIYLYFELVVEDFWGLTRDNIVKGDPFNLFTKIYVDELVSGIFDNEYTSLIYAIAQTDDGGILATGKRPWAGGHSWYVKKTDKLGNEIYNEIIGNGEGLDIVKTNDGGYLISGGWTQYTLVKTDNNGLIVSKINNNRVGHKLVKAQDSNIFMIHINSPHITKINSNGNIIWDKTIQYDNSRIRLRNYCATNDNGLIIIGSKETTPYEYGWIKEVYLRKLNSSGNTIWEKTISTAYNGLSIIQAQDNGYILLANKDDNQFLIKIDEQGNELWNRDFGFGGFKKIEKTSDGGYIVYGNSLQKVDVTGNREWETWPKNAYRPYADLEQTSDDAYILSGYFFNYGNGSGPFIMKVDPWGLIKY